MSSGLLHFTESTNIKIVMSKVAPFSIGPVTSRCLPFRTVKGMGRHQLNPFQNAELVAWAVSQNLAETTSFYDDDVALPWTPQAADFYKDPNSQFWKHLADVKAKLDAVGVEVFSVSCDLAAHDCFTYGALTNKDAAIRELAIKKIDRAIQIGHFFNAAVFVFDADAEGFDSPFTINWLEALQNLTNGLNHIEDVIKGEKFENYMGACLAPRKSVPFQYGYVNNVGDALALIHGNLRTPEFWGICPSTYQLEQSGWSAAPATIANLAACGGLACVKIGSGTQKLADRPLPPLFGTANLKETVQTLWILAKLGWQGVVELDSMLSPTEVKVSGDVVARKQFVANASSALTIALELALRIKDEALSELTPPEADLMTAAVFCGVDVDDIINKTVKGGVAAPVEQPATAAEPPAEPTPQEEKPAVEEKTEEPAAEPVAGQQEPKRHDGSKKHQRNRNNRNKRDRQSSEPWYSTAHETAEPAASATQEAAAEAPAAPSVEPPPVPPVPPVPSVEPPPVPVAEPVVEKQSEPVVEQPAAEKQLELVFDQPAATEVAPAEPVAETPAAPAESTEAAEAPAGETPDDKTAKAKAVKKRVYRRTTGIRKITKKK